MNLTKYELAELLIYADNIDDILINYNFRQDMKFEFSKIAKSTKKIIKLAFGETNLDELDEFKIKIRKFLRNEIKGKIKLLDE